MARWHRHSLKPDAIPVEPPSVCTENWSDESMSMVDLPSREQLARAISPWWSGGGTASLIVDVCRGSEATIAEAKDVAERLTTKVSNGLNFVSRDIVEETVEIVRAVGAATSSRRKEKPKPSTRFPGLAWDPAKGWVWASGSSPKPEYDPDRCVYMDGVTCPQCSKIYDERIVHGHLLSEEETTARIGEVKALLMARDQERETT